MIKYSLLILFNFIGITVYCQDMLVEQIAGKEIVRENFNDEGNLSDRQIFEVGKLETNSGKFSVEIEVKLFDEDNEFEEKYMTEYTCEPSKSEVLLNVFQFARKRDAEYVVETSSPGFKNLYDFNFRDKVLDNLKITMSVQSGMLSLFGSRNVLSLIDRKLSKKEDGFTLKSTLLIEAYLGGFKVRTKSFQVIENFDQNRLLKSQLFKTESEGYFMVHYSK